MPKRNATKRAKRAEKKSGFVGPQRGPIVANVDPRPNKPRKTKRKGGAKTPKPHHISAVCKVTDPFCPASKGSKWPDGTASNTLTEQFRGQFYIPNPAGNSLTVFSATAPFGLNNATVVGTTATLSAAALIYKTASMLETYGASYRIVSFGIIFRCIASATSAAGTITLGTAPQPALSAVISLGQESYNEVIVKAIQPGMEVSWISAPVGTGARDFVAPSTATTNLSADWMSCYCEIQGAGTNPVAAEWFMNVEFTSLASARALTSIATPNPPKSTAAEQATSHVHTSLGSFVEGGVKAVESAVANAASTALSSFMDDPLESLSSLFAMF
jgi:hypothetical protein